MTLSIYQASIPVFLRGLDVLSVLLDRAAAHAEAELFASLAQCLQPAGP